eukprot:maker-scaffold21_size687808-snap-gene-1.14 protein:Tk09833 transcript:maker-scaffold21_size687808-snap-gene-1.14-mRNA-1 annotation:"hypothetical protein L798_06018"
MGPQRRSLGWSRSQWSCLLLLAFFETVCTKVGISEGVNPGKPAPSPRVGSAARFMSTPFSALGKAAAVPPADLDLRLRATPDYPPPENHSDSAPSPGWQESEKSRGAKEKVRDSEGTITVLGSPIKFDPDELDFQDQPLGIPIIRKVLVQNLNDKSSIQMLSISGNTVHFHCSFFTEKVIPPSGNTTFDVVFLGRENGAVENTLYIHTSAGSFRFLVKASGTPNPYRLKPFVGVKVPINSSYSPVIQMHNPHPVPIQVLEMFSFGGDLHLELPSGDTEGPQALWEIPPYQTKPVMKAFFVARNENNHTSYIRIKTNTTEAQFLYLPMEIEVSSQPGIYCPLELIDFGLLPSRGPGRTIQLMVLNSGSKPISIQSVIATPVTDAMTIDFTASKALPNTALPTVVAEVTFDPSLVTSQGVHSGKIVIKSKNSQFKVTIPYRAEILNGEIEVNDQCTHFHLKYERDEQDRVIENPEPLEIHRNLSVTNRFLIPVVIHDLTLPPEAEKFFTLSPFQPIILKPGQTIDLAEMGLKKFAWRNRILDSHILLHTNISNMEIPLFCYHGQVTPFFPGSPSQDLLDFGTLGMLEKRDIYFTIINKNPVSVMLRGWGSNQTGSLVELMGVDVGTEAQILQRANFSGMARQLIIEPGHFMVFRIGIHTKKQEGTINATVFVETDHDALDVFFRYTVAKGSLSTVPYDLAFEPAFPGKVAKLNLTLSSTFAQEMKVTSVVSVPPDPRIKFQLNQTQGGKISLGDKNYIGQVTFDPGSECREKTECYSGFSIKSKAGKEWYQGAALHNPDLAESDFRLVERLQATYAKAVSPSSRINLTLNLDTDQVRGFLFRAKVDLILPRVLSLPEIHFPLTQVGNSSFKEFILTNPSHEEVYYHLVPLQVYPNGHLQASRIRRDGARTYTESDHATFKIVSVIEISSKEPLRSFGDDLENKLGRPLHPETKGFILKAAQRAKVKLKFQPSATGENTQAILVRNNLTGVEVMDFTANSVLGSLQFGNWRMGDRQDTLEPGSSLRFEMKEKHLKDCLPDSKRPLHQDPLLSVKRSFKVKNTGMTPLFIQGFDVEDQPCQAYGFRVLNCESFSLKPEEQKDIVVAFTPDFTLSKVSRTLSVHSTLSPPHKTLNFTMEATIPHHMLALCSRALPRPTLEGYLYVVVNMAMACFGLMIFLVGCYDSERIVKTSIFSRNLLPCPSVGREDARPPANAKVVLWPLEQVFGLVGHVLPSRTAEVDESSEIDPETKTRPGEKVRKASLVSALPAQTPKPPTPTNQSRKAKKQQRNSTLKKKNFSQVNNNFEDVETSSTATECSNGDQDDRHELANHTSKLPAAVPTPGGKGITTNKRTPPDLMNFTTQKEMLELQNMSTAKVQHAPFSKGTKSKIQPSHKKTKEEGLSQPNPPPEPSAVIKKKVKAAGKVSGPMVDKNHTKRAVEKISQDEARRESQKNPGSKGAKESLKAEPCHGPYPVGQSEKSVKMTSSESSVSLPTSPCSDGGEGAPSKQPSFFSNDVAHHNSLIKQTQKPKVTPIGKILPEPKKTENLGAQFGPIGAKPMRKSTWSDSPAEARPTPIDPHIYVQPREKPRGPLIPQRGAGEFAAALAPLQRSASSSAYQGRNSLDVGVLQPPLAPQHGSPTRTLMQDLQAERRQRTEEFLRSTNMEWPGFEQFQTDYISTLWDAPPDQPQREVLPMPGPSNWGANPPSSDVVWPSAAYGISVNPAVAPGLAAAPMASLPASPPAQTKEEWRRNLE